MNALVDAVAILSSCQQVVLSANWFVSETSVKRYASSFLLYVITWWSYGREIGLAAEMSLDHGIDS